MKGTVLEYNEGEGTGVISADDGERYVFSTVDVAGGSSIRRASKVDFSIVDGKARDIYRAVGSVESLTGEKNRMIAGVLALFLGAFGVHKFYLGKTKAGVIMLVIFLSGWILLGIPSMMVGALAFVEAMIYFTKRDDEFQQRYVEGDKAWL